MPRRIKEKRERALGTKLFLKAERCNSPKCATIRKPYRPGAHGRRRSMPTEFGRQLQEKQKIQLFYGLTNHQLQNLFSELSKEKIMAQLEQRLDRVVFLIGFAGSPRIGRQFVSHGHIMVNGRRVTVPSYHVKIGDVISVRPESRKAKIFENVEERLHDFSPPEWLTITSLEELKGECIAESISDDFQFPFDINLVGQFYSR